MKVTSVATRIHVGIATAWSYPQTVLAALLAPYEIGYNANLLPIIGAICTAIEGDRAGAATGFVDLPTANSPGAMLLVKYPKNAAANGSVLSADVSYHEWKASIGELLGTGFWTAVGGRPAWGNVTLISGSGNRNSDVIGTYNIPDPITHVAGNSSIGKGIEPNGQWGAANPLIRGGYWGGEFRGGYQYFLPGTPVNMLGLTANLVGSVGAATADGLYSGYLSQMYSMSIPSFSYSPDFWYFLLVPTLSVSPIFYVNGGNLITGNSSVGGDNNFAYYDIGPFLSGSVTKLNQTRTAPALAVTYFDGIALDSGAQNHFFLQGVRMGDAAYVINQNTF